MKSLKIFLLLIILLLATTGCSKEQTLNNLVNLNNITKIEIHHPTGPNPIKVSNKQKDIEKFISIINNVHYKKSSNQENLKGGWSYFVVIYYKNGNKSTISFAKKRIKYWNNNTYYELDKKDINIQIVYLYNSLPQTKNN